MGGTVVGTFLVPNLLGNCKAVAVPYLSHSAMINILNA